MAVKNIYVRPGNYVNVHVVPNDDFEATKAGWNEYLETRSKVYPPSSFGLIIRGQKAIEVSTTNCDVYGGRQQGRYPHPKE